MRLELPDFLAAFPIRMNVESFKKKVPQPWRELIDILASSSENSLGKSAVWLQKATSTNGREWLSWPDLLRFMSDVWPSVSSENKLQL